MRRWQRLDDDMEAMCGDVLVSFDGDRKPPTQRDGSKSASRRSASPLRRPDSGGAPIRIADSDPSGLFDALVPSISKTWPRDFLSSAQTYTSLVSGNRKESGHCVSNLAGQIYVCLSTEATVR